MSHHSSDSSQSIHLHAAPGSYEKMSVQDHSDDLGHASPLANYLKSFIALIILTAITVGITRFDFGNMNLVVAMIVASIKASIVALFFMHLKYEKFTTWIYAAFPLVLLGIMMGGIFLDNPFRAKPTPVGVQQEAPKEASATH
jgi:cytochrome c oxidase subunit 4